MNIHLAKQLKSYEGSVIMANIVEQVQYNTIYHNGYSNLTYEESAL